MIFAQNEATAARRRFMLYLVDATDGITAETGEAAGQPQVSKNGGAFANTTATLTAIGNGSYYVELTATELNTAGNIVVRYKSANTAEFSLAADVLAINIHDTVRAGLTALPNANAEAAGGLYTRGVGAGQINQDANGRVDTRTAAMAADVITAAATATDFSTEVNAVPLSVLGALPGAASSGDPNTTNTMVAMLKQIINTLEGTAGIPTFPAAVSPANAVSLAEVIRSIWFTMSTQLDAAMSTRASAAQATAIQADTDDIQARIPAALVSGRMSSNVEAWRGTAVAVPAVAGVPYVDVLNWAGNPASGGAVGGYPSVYVRDGTAAGEIDTSSGRVQLTEAQIDQIVDEVWDELTSGHISAGTTGRALGDINANTVGIDNLVWDEPLAGHAVAGSAGAQLAAIGTYTDTEIAAIKAVTDQIVFGVAGAVNTNVTNISGDSLAADLLEAIMDGTLVGSVNDAAASTTAWITSGLTLGANDRINGRLLTFISGALKGEQTAIVDWVDSAGVIMVTALTAPPANGVAFVIT